tara:strand:- start:534 stop:746 length:213 start_codon:yes stop_codon:yes gene_type:complete
MAEKTTWLEAIPIDAREELMHDLSADNPSDLVPLQINDRIYWIPLEVNMLIKALENDMISDIGTEDEGIA